MGPVPLGEVTRVPAPPLLWALRSFCDLACKYCYFADESVNSGNELGLSHVSSEDLRAQKSYQVAQHIVDSGVGRVFLAGGEPLSWKPAFRVIDLLAGAGVEVVVCTNGVALAEKSLAPQLLDAGVTAFSVSLDRRHAVDNDEWRPDRKGEGTWDRTVQGIQNLVSAKSASTPTKVGVYSVVTRTSVDEIFDFAQFVEELGCDYFVPQPVALPRWHQHYDELHLGTEDLTRWQNQLELCRARVNLSLPPLEYDELIAMVLSHPETTHLPVCTFGGHPKFMKPNGDVLWCPSAFRPGSETAPSGERVTITMGAAGGDGSGHACDYFSRDCVNMFVLANFDELIR